MKGKRKVKITIAILLVMGISLILLSFIYTYLVMPIDKNSKADIEIVIEPGMSTRDIGKLLEEREVIRSSQVFVFYTRISKCNSLKASTYNLSKNMSLPIIVDKICKGNNYNDNVVNITFKEGKRITDYAKLISREFSISYDEVIKSMNDVDYLKSLQSDYWFLTDEMLNQNIYYPLEGYLAPDTYQFDKNSDVKQIIEVMLDQMAHNLEKYKDKLIVNKQVHNYITMASLTELEGVTKKDRKMIVGVFNNRLQNNMNLGSDVTTYYALQKPMTEDLTAQEFQTSNPYNTRSSDMIGKLPVGPICSVSKESIEAAINPTNNNYLYFVADKNGKIYYNKTNSEHLQTVKEIKEAGNWIW